ncbi:MAG: DNA polymerase, partial [Rhabdochlamydiaceae bacterium]
MRSDLPDIREMFTAGEGHVFVEGDLKGADAQIVAAEAKDQELLDLFQTGIDIHTRNAGIVYPGISISPSLRQRAKNGVHAVNYGVHERTLSVTLNCSQEEALQFISNWFKKHPKIRHWQREIWKQLRKFQEIRNAW